eukprot:bmy_01943T0
MWPNCEVALFINGPLALADEIPFLLSFNGVILIPGNADGFLLPKYFKKALQLRPTQKPLSLAVSKLFAELIFMREEILDHKSLSGLGIKSQAPEDFRLDTERFGRTPDQSEPPKAI